MSTAWPRTPIRLSSSLIPALAVLGLSCPAWVLAGDALLPSRSTPVTLEVSAKLGAGPARENSGIVRSRQHADLFWMQNDSGDEPRVYPVHRDGSVYTSSREPKTPGVLIAGAINVDWEDIAVDSDGHLIVADFGNNGNDRRDLVLYYIDEPSPAAERTVVKKKLFFRYPDQTQFRAGREAFNFDAEALFTAGTTPYVLTKHRSDTQTTLYRFDSPRVHETNVLKRVGTFDVGGKVTGADASADGRHLAVITYDRIWLFERPATSDNYFAGRKWWIPYAAKQVEAVAFADDDTLILGDEDQAVLYELPLAVVRGER